MAAAPDAAPDAAWRAHLRFAAASCNRQPGALSTLPSHHLFAYASHNNAFIASTGSRPTTAVLALHDAPITALQLVAAPAPLLLSAATDGTLAHAAPAPRAWRGRAWPAHAASCVALHAAPAARGLLLASVGADACVAVWRRAPAAWARVAACPVAPAATARDVLPECVAVLPLGDDAALVALGGTDRAVQLYHLAGDALSFAARLPGHRDWVRGLAFRPSPAEVLLATASTDGTARLWRVTESLPTGTFGSLTLKLPARTLSFAKTALLDEHTAAVHTVAFSDDGHLLTASMDCSVAVWRVGTSTTCVARFGLMGGASAHALGFFGAAFASASAEHIIAHNFSGALHRWRLADTSDASYQYVAHAAPTGHFAPVTDLAWAPGGEFLLSCSTDKTARIFAEVDGSFVEWARPQVHGHSLFAVAFCDRSGRRYVSGAEERMLRVFEAPSSFRLPGSDATPADAREPMGASLPQLGLSNKPVFAEGPSEDGDAPTPDIVSSFGVDRAVSPVPLEEDLNQHRLWPETAKLYGHGNEISCVAVDLQNAVLASACRAQTAKDAVVILWDVTTGVECGRLAAHELTVNQLRFSTDGASLLSVSKDRSLAVFRKGDGRFGFRVALHRKAAHTRLIYCCTWIRDGEIVATGARDKCVKLFSVTDCGDGTQGVELVKQKFDSAVTALDSVLLSDKVVLAAGFDSGDIRFFTVSLGEAEAALMPVLKCQENMRCGTRITGISWRPAQDDNEERDSELQVGIASEDCSVRVYSVTVDNSEESVAAL